MGDKFNKEYGGISAENNQENVPAMVWECIIDNTENKIRPNYVNNYVYKLLKYSSEEFLSSEDFFVQILHPDDKEIVPARIKNIIKNKKDDIIEFRWIDSSGNILWIESHFMLLPDKQNNVTGIRIISFDTTRGKIMEHELLQRIKQHAAISSLGTRALQGTSISGLMNDAVLEIKEVLNCEYVKILELVPSKNMFVLKAAAGWQPELIGNASVSAANNSEAGYALLVDEPVIINDLSKENRFKKQALLYDHNVIAGMSVVIKGKVNNYGVISVHTTSKRFFNEDDSNFLNSIANIIAAAIERKQSENDLEISVKEKEVLLKEIHHRVKNNLQVISSLLHLQSRTISDPQTLEVFNESRNRIRSMALIHEKLYQSRSFFKINFAEYVNDLLKNLFDSYFFDHSRIKKTVLIENIQLNIDEAVALGLIINELVSNSIKHAFTRAYSGYEGENEVIIKMERNDKTNSLSVKDNGDGFPEDINFKDTETLGLQLVNTLTEQLEGEIFLNKDNGTEFVIKFAVSQK
jgi:PAS domain S-box-containing protein